MRLLGVQSRSRIHADLVLHAAYASWPWVLMDILHCDSGSLLQCRSHKSRDAYQMGGVNKLSHMLVPQNLSCLKPGNNSWT